MEETSIDCVLSAIFRLHVLMYIWNKKFWMRPHGLAPLNL